MAARNDSAGVLEATSAGVARPPGRVERRRARVRQRLVEAALELMRSRDIEAVTVEEITESADIARRSFYHHFDSKHDLLVPIARSRTEALNRRIDRAVERIEDPAERVSLALHHTFRGILEDPLCRWFVLRSGLAHDRLAEGIGTSAIRDLELGSSSGRFRLPGAASLQRFLSGAIIGILSGRLEGELADSDLADAVECVLRVLGVPVQEAHDLAHRPPPSLPESPGPGASKPQTKPRRRARPGRRKEKR